MWPTLAAHTISTGSEAYEPEARHWPIRAPDPLPHCSSAVGQDRNERRGMIRDARSGDRGIGDHDDATDRRSVPSALTSKKHRYDAALAAERAQEFLDVYDASLDLDDQKRPGRGMPTHDVHHPAVAIVVERILGQDLPTMILQPADDALNESRMIVVEQLG